MRASSSLPMTAYGSGLRSMGGSTFRTGAGSTWVIPIMMMWSTRGVDRIQAWRRRMHPDDGVVYDQVLAGHIRGEGPFDVEYRIRGKDNTWRWIRARGQMTYNDSNEPLRMSGTNMDITQLKLAEERVIKAKEAAEKANRAKSEFLSSMSHELRTPLNAILGFAQLIGMDEGISREHQSNLTEIKKAGQHLLQLVGDVLDLAKIESGRMTMNIEPLSPVSILNEAFALLKVQAESKGVQLCLQTNDLSDRTVFADRMRLKQVFLNLLGNAIKYNRESGRVSVSCSVIEEFFRVTVEDTGRGIPAERQAEMFQPFNRLGAELGNIEGTGVGLVITSQLMAHMQGRIDFTSEEGQGSCFWVDMPLEQDRTTRPGLAPAPVASKVEDPQAVYDLDVREPKHILYVEDNVSNQRLVTRFLARYPQLRLEVAHDALRGLYLARTNRPDLILMDINLPGMDGYEALEVLKNDPGTRSTPVIALSANAMVHDLEKGNSAGFCHYLTKPINLEQLVEAINYTLGED